MTDRQSLTRSLLRGGIVFVLCVIIFALYSGAVEALRLPDWYGGSVLNVR